MGRLLATTQLTLGPAAAHSKVEMIVMGIGTGRLMQYPSGTQDRLGCALEPSGIT
jgi:hypothetical protein